MPNKRSAGKKKLGFWVPRQLHADWMAAHDPGQATEHVVELMGKELRRMKRRRAGKVARGNGGTPGAERE